MSARTCRLRAASSGAPPARSLAPEKFQTNDGGFSKMESLSSRHCVPCHGGVPRLTNEEIEPLLQQLDGWRVVEEHHLLKDYKFPNFADALSFVNRVGQVAEREGHHPDINFGWGYA